MTTPRSQIDLMSDTGGSALAVVLLMFITRNPPLRKVPTATQSHLSQLMGNAQMMDTGMKIDMA